MNATRWTVVASLARSLRKQLLIDEESFSNPLRVHRPPSFQETGIDPRRHTLHQLFMAANTFQDPFHTTTYSVCFWGCWHLMGLAEGRYDRSKESQRQQPTGHVGLTSASQQAVPVTTRQKALFISLAAGRSQWSWWDGGLVVGHFAPTPAYEVKLLSKGRLRRV